MRPLPEAAVLGLVPLPLPARTQANRLVGATLRKERCWAHELARLRRALAVNRRAAETAADGTRVSPGTSPQRPIP